MKKLLIGVLIILLIILAYFAIFEGITLGSFHVLSVEQIKQENDRLEQEIAQTQVLMNSDYKTKTDELESSVSQLLVAKDEYHDLASISTEGELAAASQDEIYTVEYLWTRFGRHATAEGVNLRYEISTGTTGEADVKNISFTVSGQYIPIINFVTALEDDDELGFRIENFKIAPGGDYLQATFLVRNVRIKIENVSSSTTGTTNNSVSTQSTDTQNTQPIDNTANTTDTTDTTNTQQ